jgi:hypothetical protein
VEIAATPPPEIAWSNGYRSVSLACFFSFFTYQSYVRCTAACGLSKYLKVALSTAATLLASLTMYVQALPDSTFSPLDDVCILPYNITPTLAYSSNLRKQID